MVGSTFEGEGPLSGGQHLELKMGGSPVTIVRQQAPTQVSVRPPGIYGSQLAASPYVQHIEADAGWRNHRSDEPGGQAVYPVVPRAH